jgi:hydrophobic/amphiphilic exporter-1 (mainly G- bacteria), HAE1 family
LGWGDGAEIRSPMAITVIGGLAFSTLLTLILIPVIYEVVDRRKLAQDRAPAVSEGPSFSPGAPRLADAD